MNMWRAGVVCLLLGCYGAAWTEGAATAQDKQANISSVGQLAIDKDNIKVWTFKAPNNPAYNYRATTTFNKSVKDVKDLLMQTDKLLQWIPYAKDIKVSDVNEATGDYILQIILDLPFPLLDREIVAKGKMSTTSDGTVVMINKSTDDKRFPPLAHTVRIPNYEGNWYIKPMAANKVEVTVTGYADPGGMIPLSIVNMFIQKQPYLMLKNMGKQL